MYILFGKGVPTIASVTVYYSLGEYSGDPDWLQGSPYKSVNGQ